MDIKKVNAGILKVFFNVPDLKVGPEDKNSPASVLPESLKDNLPILFDHLGINSILEIDPRGGSLKRAGFDLSKLSYFSGGLIEVLQNRSKFQGVDLVYVRNDISYYSNEEIFSLFKFSKSIEAKYFLSTTFPWMVAGESSEISNKIQDKAKMSVFPLLKNLIKSFGKSILPSSHPWQDYSIGGLIRRDFRRINLQKPPFSLPVPEAFIIEGDRADGYQDRSICLWQTKNL